MIDHTAVRNRMMQWATFRESFMHCSALQSARYLLRRVFPTHCTDTAWNHDVMCLVGYNMHGELLWSTVYVYYQSRLLSKTYIFYSSE